MDTTRRSLLVGLGAIIAAPAIVRITSIMPVKVMPRIRALAPAGYGLAGDFVRFRDGVPYKEFEEYAEILHPQFHYVMIDGKVLSVYPDGKIVCHTTDSL